jgi:hypothetical protein
MQTGLNKRFIERLNIRKMQVTPVNGVIPCRSELARDGGRVTGFILVAIVIVDHHREQARSYGGAWCFRKQR